VIPDGTILGLISGDYCIMFEAFNWQYTRVKSSVFYKMSSQRQLRIIFCFRPHVVIPTNLLWDLTLGNKLASSCCSLTACCTAFRFTIFQDGIIFFISIHTYIHGPCRRFRGDQNDEDTRTFCGKFLYNAIASTNNVTEQHKNCPSSGIDDRPGRDLFRVLKRSPISQLHTLGLRRGYSDGKAVGSRDILQRGCNLRRSPVVFYINTGMISTNFHENVCTVFEPESSIDIKGRSTKATYCKNAFTSFLCSASVTYFFCLL